MITDAKTGEVWLTGMDDGLSPEGCAALFEFLEGLNPSDHKLMTAKLSGKLRLDHWNCPHLKGQ